MCSINKSAHTKKNLETYLMSLVVAIEKGAFGSPSTKVANFAFLLIA